jgi:tetratricopeptide (TPR) repeat protein
MATPQDRKPFPVRLPVELHQALKERAESLPDITMNDLVIAGIKNVLEGTELTVVTGSEMTDARLDLAVAAIGGEIGALKGTAQHFLNLGRTNLAFLLYWTAAEAIGRTDPKDASKELARTAVEAKTQRPLEMALLRAALRWNPNNEVAKNRLGQLLYFEQDYEGALEHLAPVTQRDNRAKLFHGWATLHVATSQGNRAGITRGREEIVSALETWAFGERDARQRHQWLRQVATLDEQGPEFRQTVLELIAYANDNTSWPPIALEDLQGTRSATADAEVYDLSTASVEAR